MYPTRKICSIAASVIVALSGILLIFIIPVLLKLYIRSTLVLTPNSEIFKMWEHFPKAVLSDFYLFNWTNPNDIYNTSVKPRFEEMGPYRFLGYWGKTNITWNDNGTVTFQPQKYWYYDRNKKNGDLQDEVTNVNPTALAAAYGARTWPYMVRKGVSLSLSKILSTIKATHTIAESLFVGYSDPLIKIARTFPFFASENIPPWDKFSWFYKSNGTAWYESVYNMGTGNGTTFAKIYNRDYKNKSRNFYGVCAEVDSSTGENFDPDFLDDHIKIFSPELCRWVVLQYSETVKVDGVIGRKYVFGDRMLDNGTKFPENKCSCNGDCLPSGVFNISSCRFGAPVFASLPHFYKADPYYTSLIESRRPEKDKHEFYVIVEPNTGLPLEAKIRLQVNLMLQSVPGISMYENLPTVLVPALWCDQQMTLPDSVMLKLKRLQDVPLVCTIIGIFMFVAGLLLLLYLVCDPQREKGVLKPNSVAENKEQKKLLAQ